MQYCYFVWLQHQNIWLKHFLIASLQQFHIAIMQDMLFYRGKKKYFLLALHLPPSQERTPISFKMFSSYSMKLKSILFQIPIIFLTYWMKIKSILFQIPVFFLPLLYPSFFLLIQWKSNLYFFEYLSFFFLY